ncbi:MAG TPA: hypothetical protein DD381_14380 [Lentisphaeria bacterium]|nr:MAG: hypothetical protein A2X47_00890 [Lentisphaerae bacterium GWF2_38_69]HBM17512.1 hypothetical protein [Lentisphaeria bacterium]
MPENLICALDLSGSFASFALTKGKDLVLAESFILQNRNNAVFFSSFFSKCSEYEIDISMIEKWIIGTGPGSFTGLRIASAYVMGITYGSFKKAVGISSAFPVAIESAIEKREKLGIIFPSSKEAVYFCTIFSDENGSLSMENTPVCLAKSELKYVESYKRFAVLCVANENEAIRASLPKNSSVIFLNRFPIEKMFCDFKGNYTCIEDLIYLKPPSVTIKV